MNFKERWKNLTPGNKKRVVWSIIIALIILGGALYSRGKEPLALKAEPKRKEVSIDEQLLNKSLFAANHEEIKRRDQQIKNLKQQFADDKKEVADQMREFEYRMKNLKQTGGMKDFKDETGFYSQGKNRGNPPATYAPEPRPPSVVKQSSRKGSTKLEENSERFIGGISVVSAPPGEKALEEKDKKKEKIYLPSGSFMAAHLMSGLDAPTVESARGNPMPVLLRIKNLAILPNRVKANLKGCFVIAHGYGDLASERVYLRLVALSCLTKKGQAVIDQPIKGYVSDADGKIGLSGRVVSKMGTLIARSMIAGFFEGIGDAFEAASITQSVSPLGVTQTLDPEQVAQSGVGRGIASAAGEIQKFYMELARQTMPVIEIGATKEVTLIVTDGEWLEIKCIDEGELCDG